MAEDGMTLEGFGDAVRRLRGVPDALEKRLQLATRQNAVGLEGEIKKGMVAQAPGGQAYQPLHPWTIGARLAVMSLRYRKKVQANAAKITARGGIAHKALINHGDLLGSITHRMFGNDLSAVVGVNRFAKARNGKPMVNIARIVFYGAVIQVTPGMRAYMHKNGMHLRDTTTHIVIPPRPTIEPAYEAYRDTIVDRYTRAVHGAAKAI